MSISSANVFPPFGFKSTQWYTNQINQVVMIITLQAQGGIISRTDVSAMMEAQSGVREQAAKIAKVDALSKILGYIPVVGTVMGIKRIVAFHAEEGSSAKRQHMMRAVVESLSIGIILIPVDLIATAILSK